MSDRTDPHGDPVAEAVELGVVHDALAEALQGALRKCEALRQELDVARTLRAELAAELERLRSERLTRFAGVSGPPGVQGTKTPVQRPHLG